MSYNYTVTFRLTSDQPLDLSPLLDAAHEAADTMAQDTSDNEDVCCDFDEGSVSVREDEPVAKCWSCQTPIYNHVERYVAVVKGRAVPRTKGQLYKPVCTAIACSEHSFRSDEYVTLMC